MTKGTLEPGPKRDVAIGKYSLTLANEVPVDWELRDGGEIFFKSKTGEGLIQVWRWGPPDVEAGES